METRHHQRTPNHKLVLIAEDHAILRGGLRALLANEADLEVVGEAQNGREAIQFVDLLDPDLVLMDLAMPHTNGMEAIRTVKQRNPHLKIIALTVHKTEEYVLAALHAGADGYVLKDDTHEELLSAIRHVLNGSKYLSPGISGQVVSGYLKSARDEGAELTKPKH